MTRQSKRSMRSRGSAGALKLVLTAGLACSVGLTGAAALSSVEHRLKLPNRYLALQTAANPQKSSAQKSRANHPPQRMGEWLQSHKNLPLDQQEKALEKDPNFKKLPPDRQAALRDRLRKFNSLPPEQRDLALKRMNFWASLTREQRQQLRDANQKLQGLPEDRRVAVHKALRHLRQMAPHERQQVMDSDRFKATFSDQEQGILKDLASINPPENGTAAQPSPAAQSPKP
jgi:hypothetical protein